MGLPMTRGEFLVLFAMTLAQSAAIGLLVISALSQ